jgi:filamentous hemagglutinin
MEYAQAATDLVAKCRFPGVFGSGLPGALLSGDSVSIQTTDDITNAGTILGRKVVQIEAGNIHNIAGLIQAQDVALQASQDINNTGGTVVAGNSLVTIAGRDLNVTSTTASSSGTSGSYSYSQTGVDRVNDVNARAAQVTAGKTLDVAAGNNIILQAGQATTNVDQMARAKDQEGALTEEGNR